MNWAEALAELRTARLDDNQGEQLWSDAELLAHYNDAIRQACIRLRCLIDSTTRQVCQRPLAAGQRFIRLHPSVLAVRFLRVGDRPPIRGVTARRMFQEDPCWLTSEPVGASYGPRNWIPDYQEGQIWLDRPVDEATTVHLTVWRMPLDTETVEGPDDDPVIPVHHHADLLPWVEYRAYDKRDAETSDPQRAERAKAEFEARMGPLPSATAIRLWGVSPRTGGRAQFL